MKPVSGIVHFGPEWGVFVDDPSHQKPYLASVHNDQWTAEAAADKIREQGEVRELVIKKRMVYHSDWEVIQ